MNWRAIALVLAAYVCGAMVGASFQSVRLPSVVGWIACLPMGVIGVLTGRLTRG